MADDAAASSAESSADGHFEFPTHTADKKKIGDIRARNEENQTGDSHEEAKVGGIDLLKFLNTGTAAGKDYVDFGQELFVLTLQRRFWFPPASAGRGRRFFAVGREEGCRA